MELTCLNCGLILDDAPLENEATQDGQVERAMHTELAIAGTMPVNGSRVKSSWLLTRKEKNLLSATKQIRALSEALVVPKRVADDGIIVFKRINDANLLSGHGLNRVCVASIYYSCLQHGFGKLLVDISRVSEVPVSKISKSFKMITKSLGLPPHRLGVDELILRFGSQIGIPQETISKSIELYEEARKKYFISSWNPRTQATVCLYLASKLYALEIPQRRFTNATGVIEAVIRDRAKIMAKKLT